jgi:TRAP-type uncharacterized transport system substrate-binding protein
MTLGDRPRRYWLALAIAGMTLILLAAGGFTLATLPPRTIVMATGAEGGANHELGLRYREILAQSGVRLQLLPTAGSLENVAKLRDPKSRVGVGFIQGGTTTKKEAPELESLGAIFYEPLWFFHRSEITDGTAGLRGRRVSIGPEGSGARMLGLEIAKRLKIDSIVGELLGFPPQLAAEKLISGELDAAFIVTAWESPVVQQLSHAPGIEIASFARVDAYVALYPFLNKLVLPAGVADLADNRPPADVHLLAPKGSLAVRADLHPAIQYLLLSAAAQIHSQPGIFQKAGQFPAPESIDLPLSEEAQRFYKTGRPFLQNYLPFWAATLIERMLVVFLPLAAVLYPLFRFMPGIYGWFRQSKVVRLYDEMRVIESEMDDLKQDAGEIDAKLDQLDQRASRLPLPTAYAGTLYTLRSHIALIRDRLAVIRTRLG